MNLKLLFVGSTAGSFLVGAIAGYVVAKNLPQSSENIENEDDFQEELQKILDEYAPDPVALKNFTETATPDDVPFVVDEPSVTKEDKETRVMPPRNGKGRFVRLEPPVIIPLGVFSANIDGFPEKEVTWYKEDEVLTDDHDNVLDDVVALLGDAAHSKLMNLEDTEQFYVKNVREGTYYSIVQSNGAYRKEVLGDFTEETDDTPWTG